LKQIQSLDLSLIEIEKMETSKLLHISHKQINVQLSDILEPLNRIIFIKRLVIRKEDAIYNGEVYESKEIKDYIRHGSGVQVWTDGKKY
jgi:hypothetical protein